VISGGPVDFALAARRPGLSNQSQALNLSLVTETYPPEINGVAMTLSHLVEGLAQRGHTVTVVRPRQGRSDTPRADGLHAEDLCPGLPIPGYPFLRLGLPVRGRLLRRWRHERPDLVHIATEGPLGYAALSAATALRIPVSSTFHTNFHSYSRHYGAAFLTRPALAYLRHFHNRTRVTLSPTAELNAELARDGFRNLRLLSRGVNTRVFTPDARSAALRASWGAGPDDLVVVHVSRLAAEKNYPLLFDAFRAIAAQRPDARLVIASDGPLRRKLQRRMPDAVFTGFLPREDLARCYASGDLFLYASLTETFGNVVTEAMASGLPVVAFNYAAAARYIRNGENGWHVPFGDAAAFVASSTGVARDPALRRRLGTAARETALTISWDRVIDGFERDLLDVSRAPETAVTPYPSARP
jgi:glycosyltransferase involved in cell wall biosynthesis